MKYMLTIQHDDQKVAYIEFTADNDLAALKAGESIFQQYKTVSAFMPRMYESGNFTGYKPPIKSCHVSKWVNDANACNAWGRPCGGYWSTIEKGIKS